MSIIDYSRTIECLLFLKTTPRAVKRFTMLSVGILGIIFVSSCDPKAKIDTRLAEIEKKYQDSLSIVRNELKEAKAEIELLSYPADQRLQKAQSLLEAGELDKAADEIEQLKRVFPNSAEASSSSALLAKLSEIKEAKRKEEERIKALGYKAFKDNPTIKFDNVTYSFSGFTFGRTFTFEYVLDVNEYSYEVADKNCTYILASLAISTKENYASNPSVYACEIVDGKLKEIDDFRIEYATYNTYGASIGNYSETSHDFSKVSSVKYKMAAQIPQSYTSKPIVIIVRKISGYLSGEISIDEVRKNYEVIKILNRNRL